MKLGGEINIVVENCIQAIPLNENLFVIELVAVNDFVKGKTICNTK
jgi:hypothetical protein